MKTLTYIYSLISLCIVLSCYRYRPILSNIEVQFDCQKVTLLIDCLPMVLQLPCLTFGSGPFLSIDASIIIIGPKRPMSVSLVSD